MLKKQCFVLALCAFLILSGCTFRAAAKPAGGAPSVNSSQSEALSGGNASNPENSSSSGEASASGAVSGSSAASAGSSQSGGTSLSTTLSSDTSSSGNSGEASQITQEQAENLLTDYLKSKSISKETDPNLVIAFDRSDEADGHEYYVFHVFDNMKDHTSTLGWYGVKKSDGSFYDFMLMQAIN